MDKKSIIAIVALFIFLLIWQMVIMPMLPDSMVYRPPETPEVIPSSNIQPTDATPAPEKDPDNTKPGSEVLRNTQIQKKTPEVVTVKEQILRVETETFSANLTNKGATISYLALKGFHPDVKSELPLVMINQDKALTNTIYSAKITETEKGTVVTFENADIKKSITFPKKGFFINIELESKNGKNEFNMILPDLVKNSTGSEIAFAAQIRGPILSDANKEYGDNSTVHINYVEEPVAMPHIKQLQWAGFRDKYFTCFIEPTGSNTAIHNVEFISKDGLGRMSMEASGGSDKLTYSLYAGPVDKEVLYDVDKNKYVALFNYTGLDVVIHFLLWLLSLYSNIPGVNMGIAIIMLTITVKAVLFPLNLKAQSSMFMMSKLGPQMKELQEKFKDDRQQLGMAQMKLFKDNGVNPMAGCLPMFIQMPVFISLFSTIGEGFLIRHAPFFGWIKDLSAPDAIASLSFSIPLIGNDNGTTNVNLLVFLYIITMLIQQSMMPKSTDPNQQQMQKSMKFMMIFFAVLLYNYSSGLMVYFVASNILGMMESYFIKNKILPKMGKKA